MAQEQTFKRPIDHLSYLIGQQETLRFKIRDAIARNHEYVPLIKQLGQVKYEISKWAAHNIEPYQ